jgi:hypothetical protein
MRIKRLRAPTLVVAVVALVVGVSSGAMGAKLITGKDIKDGSVKSADITNGTLVTKDLKKNGVSADRLKKGTISSDKLKAGAIGNGKLVGNAVTSDKIKDGTVGSNDLANGSVTAGKLAPGAVAFPQTLWGPNLRNQAGAAQSNLATGPATPPKGTGSLHLSVTGPPDRAAFGDSIDFSGIPLDSFTSLSYGSYNPDAVPAVRPSLRFEINPHVVDDATLGGVFEFSTLTYEPAPGATGWVTHANIQDDRNWFLSGDAATVTGCVNTAVGLCTLAEVKDRLNASPDPDTAQPAISTGVYFALGSGIAATTGAVDNFVFNNFQFNFEPDGVFLTTPPAP